MSTHILTVTLHVANSEWQRLQDVELDVSALPEEHPLVIELRKAWAALEAELLAKAQRNPGDIFMLGG